MIDSYKLFSDFTVSSIMLSMLVDEEASYKLLVSNDALPSKSLSCDKEFSELSLSGKLSILFVVDI